MLDPYLYNQFSHYDYMLLYQLDAFAFSNRLLEFCKMGYDYIGAPVERYAKDWKAVGCNIGNGGFSLRKIASMIRILEQKEYIYARKPKEWKENRFLSCEDVFFAFCSTISIISLVISITFPLYLTCVQTFKISSRAPFVNIL